MTFRQFFKQHRFIVRSEYSKSGLKHLGEFEVEGYFPTLAEARKSVSDIDGKILKVLSVHRTSERIYAFPLVKYYRCIKFWYLKKIRQRNAHWGLHAGIS